MEQVRCVGEVFFREIDEVKQSYAEVGGKLLKETTNSCLKTKQKTLRLPFQRTIVFQSERIAIHFPLNCHLN